MAHHRQTIRQAVAAVLAGLPTTGPRVFKSRVWPLADDKLPCLLVFTRRDQVQDASMGRPRRLNRGVEVIVEGVVAAASEDLDDTLDIIAAEVEAAMGADPTLGGVVKQCLLDGSTSELRASEGEKPVGAIQLVFIATYRTVEGDPSTAIN